MRILHSLVRARRAGAVLMSAAVGRIRVVIGVTGGAVTVPVIFAVLVGVAMQVVVLAVLRMIGQLAGFMTFAGPEEDESDGRRENGRVTEE